MSDEQLVVVLSTEVEGDRLVVGVFGPYETEAEASEHVGILRDPREAQESEARTPDLHQPAPARGPLCLRRAGRGDAYRARGLSADHCYASARTRAHTAGPASCHPKAELPLLSPPRPPRRARLTAAEGSLLPRKSALAPKGRAFPRQKRDGPFAAPPPRQIPT